MKIKTIVSQHRRDFSATLVCEHCEHEQKLSNGYDDENFHKNVIPAIKCDECGEVAPSDYRPLKTKHEPHEIV